MRGRSAIILPDYRKRMVSAREASFPVIIAGALHRRRLNYAHAYRGGGSRGSKLTVLAAASGRHDSCDQSSLGSSRSSDRNCRRWKHSSLIVLRASFASNDRPFARAVSNRVASPRMRFKPRTIRSAASFVSIALPALHIRGCCRSGMRRSGDSLPSRSISRS